MRTRYECPFDCDWHFDFDPMVDPMEWRITTADMDEVVRAMTAHIDDTIAAHLDAEHAGWTMDALERMQRERQAELAAFAEPTSDDVAPFDRTPADCVQSHDVLVVGDPRTPEPAVFVCVRCGLRINAEAVHRGR